VQHSRLAALPLWPTGSQWLNSAGTGRNGVPQPVSGVPLPETAVPPPKVVVPPPGDAVLYFWSVNFRENHYNCCHQRSDFKA